MARPARLPLMIGAGVAAFLVVVGLATWWVVASDGEQGDTSPVLTVDGWSLSVAELEAELTALADNELYWQVRSDRGDQITPRSDDGSWSPEFVSEVLNDRLGFHLAARALARKGGTVTEEDEAEGRRIMAETFVGGAVLQQGQAATLDVVLDQFGVAQQPIVDGIAALSALRRLVALEMGDEASDEDIDLALADAIDAEAADAEIVVAAAWGTYDAESGAIVVVSRSEGGLVPVDPDDPFPEGSAPGDDGSASSTVPPDGAAPVGPPPVDGPAAGEQPVPVPTP